MTRSTRRRTALGTILGALALALAAIAAPAHADYPDHPIRLVVPFPPGGSTDVVARIVAAKAEKIIGQPLVIDNRAGAGSLIGTEFVAHAAPDGYTLLVTQTGFAVNASLISKLPYDTIRDFTSICLMAEHPGLLVANSTKPYDTFKDFVAYAKAHPGQVNYSSAGQGTWPHLSMALLANEAGLKMEHLPYKGTGPAKADLLAGRVDVKIEAYATTSEFIKTGQLKVLAVTSKQRIPELPNVPTVAESGIPDYESAYWLGIAGPAKMPPEILKKLEAAFVQASKDPDTVKQLADQFIDARGLPGKDLDARTRAEIDKWAAVVKATGIQQ